MDRRQLAEENLPCERDAAVLHEQHDAGLRAVGGVHVDLELAAGNGDGPGAAAREYGAERQVQGAVGEVVGVDLPARRRHHDRVACFELRAEPTALGVGAADTLITLIYSLSVSSSSVITPPLSATILIVCCPALSDPAGKSST